jgi:hypothetical protein
MNGEIGFPLTLLFHHKCKGPAEASPFDVRLRR